MSTAIQSERVTIASIGYHSHLLRTRNDELRKAGFMVSAATGFRSATKLLGSKAFDVLIVGHGVPAHHRHSLVKAACAKNQRCRVILMYLASIANAEAADALISATSPARALVSAIEYLVSASSTQHSSR
jgi:DNA-binding NtrC family response regulator